VRLTSKQVKGWPVGPLPVEPVKKGKMSDNISKLATGQRAQPENSSI
jgi:hypothetical protein